MRGIFVHTHSGTEHFPFNTACWAGFQLWNILQWVALYNYSITSHSLCRVSTQLCLWRYNKTVKVCYCKICGLRKHYGFKTWHPTQLTSTIKKIIRCIKGDKTKRKHFAKSLSVLGANAKTLIYYHLEVTALTNWCNHQKCLLLYQSVPKFLNHGSLHLTASQTLNAHLPFLPNSLTA